MVDQPNVIKLLSCGALCLMMAACSAGGGDSSLPAHSRPDVQRKAPTLEPAQPALEKKETITPLSEADFIKASPKQVVDKVGAPRLVRREDPMYLIQYQSKSCVVDFVFYRFQAGSDYELTRISARGHGGEPLDKAACLASLSRTGK